MSNDRDASAGALRLDLRKRVEIAAAVARARFHGSTPRTIEIDIDVGYHVWFSFVPDTLARMTIRRLGISFQINPFLLPNPDTIGAIGAAFGFSFVNVHGWTEQIAPGCFVVNIAEPVDTEFEVVGHA